MMKHRIAVFTSGGDAPGMNAAVRSVVRTAIHLGAEVFAIYEGYNGMIEGKTKIKQMNWDSVGGILHKGGTIIGSARSEAFRTREGRRTAVKNLVAIGIDKIVCIGGDGSLTGANLLRHEWRELLQELVESREISAEVAAQHPCLTIAGLPGSIDNDLVGTDMTIGADTALHRITAAIDAISSTAASHQRSFVVEVMGRKCGYLAMMGAIASGADWALIPENPPNLDAWEEKMCDILKIGRNMGRRDSIVVVAEGAQDRHGNPISSNYVKEILQTRLKEDTRVTILGHVQRGGSPTAFDRNLSTLTGAEAVQTLLDPNVVGHAYLIGIQGNKIKRIDLEKSLQDTQEVNRALKEKNYERAMELRGPSFQQAFSILRTLVRAYPHPPTPGQPCRRIGILHAGAPAPGMNTAVRAGVRLAIDKGHEVFGIANGFRGLARGEIRPYDWMSVNGWASQGGAELGTNRYVPQRTDFYSIARVLEEQKIEGLLIIGGFNAYEGALELHRHRDEFPAFNIPIVCLPTAIDNDLPNCELSIGADTALNSIIDAVDKVKRSAVASRRVFVVEVMGRTCGYLALMSSLATGAEQFYLPEEGVTLQDLQNDVQTFKKSFEHGKRLGMIIRNEESSKLYNINFMAAVFEEEGGDLFDARTAILGHLQQGGDPTPFDRIQANRLAAFCIDSLEKEMGKSDPQSLCVGLWEDKIRETEFSQMERAMDRRMSRPKEQWWLSLRPIARILAQSSPEVEER